MKSILTFFLCACLSVAAIAQEDYSQRVSPMTFVSAELANANINLTYSAPSVKGRIIWGELVPYGKVWRTGANEATIFETDADLRVGTQILPAGKYSLFTIPGENEWTVIFNKDAEQWGAYKYDASRDALRVNVKAEKSPVFHETLKMEISDNNLILNWENLRWILPIRS